MNNLVSIIVSHFSVGLIWYIIGYSDQRIKNKRNNEKLIRDNCYKWYKSGYKDGCIDSNKYRKSKCDGKR